MFEWLTEQKNDQINEQTCKQKDRNGSLFTYLQATVTVNGLENEMSGYCRFQGRKWGGRKQGNPWDPEGVERVYPCLRPPQFLTAKSTIYANFILLTVWRNVAVK